MSNRKRFICLILGPVIFALSALLLRDLFTTSGAQAIGISLWMIFWWITRPVHITITALLPALVNAFLNMVPMSDVISQYSCESIVLVFASGLIIMPWASIGLDRRIALKVLSVVGPSMKSQTIVWLCATTIFSTVLPNIAVVTLFCPIAVAMLKAAGLGCCMANGTPDAKAAADRIIGDVREDGLADLIDELWFDGPRAEPSGRDLGSPWDKIESAGGQ